jgi:hypothetical protein
MPTWSALPKSLQAKYPPPPSRDKFASQEEYEEARGFWQTSVGRSIAFALQKHREMPRLLHFRLVPHNRGLVFAEPERAAYVSQIHAAMREAKTWGQLKSLMPLGEQEAIRQWMASDEQNEERRDGEAFDPEAVPGWVDGDYPHWLQQEMASVLPARILAEFAVEVATPINGTYWHIPGDRQQEVVDALANMGFTLELDQTSPFL